MRRQRSGWQTTKAWLAHSNITGMRRILEMSLNLRELEFLSAWAREEKAENPYCLPAHQLQALHRVSGATLIRAIKAWARTTGRRDEDIFGLYDTTKPA